MISIILIYAGICISGLILSIICAGMIAMGKLIANTPDGQELRGERVRDENAKKQWSSPEQLPTTLSYVFFIIFIIGSAVLIVSGGTDTVMLIFGSVTVFSALLFATGTSLFEMMMYNQMVANLKDQKEYVKAIRG